jgi:hypothetical protein
MRDAIKSKFRQNPALLDLLQKTGDRQIEFVSSDPFWGTGKGGKGGANRLGALLMRVREELRGLRADQIAFGANSASSASSAAEEEPSLTEQAYRVASEAITAASGGLLQVGGGQGQGQGQNGIYLIINPAMGSSVEPKARRARDRGRARELSWEGMTVSKEGGGGDQEDDRGQEGGSEVHQMTTEKEGGTEVTVQKLGV